MVPGCRAARPTQRGGDACSTARASVCCWLVPAELFTVPGSRPLGLEELRPRPHLRRLAPHLWCLAVLQSGSPATRSSPASQLGIITVWGTVHPSSCLEAGSRHNTISFLVSRKKVSSLDHSSLQSKIYLSKGKRLLFQQQEGTPREERLK